MADRSFLRYRTLRVLSSLTFRYPGVPLCSTPGFMLSPVSRALESLLPIPF